MRKFGWLLEITEEDLALISDEARLMISIMGLEAFTHFMDAFAGGQINISKSWVGGARDNYIAKSKESMRTLITKFDVTDKHIYKVKRLARLERNKQLAQNVIKKQRTFFDEEEK